MQTNSSRQLHIKNNSTYSPLREASRNGEWHDFKRIELSALQVKGTAGDKITLIGGTW